MPSNMLRFTVQDLSTIEPHWVDLMTADLAREVTDTAADSISDMRIALAIKGYRDILEILEVETSGKYGVASLRAMALAFRSYAK